MPRSFRPNFLGSIIKLDKYPIYNFFILNILFFVTAYFNYIKKKYILTNSVAYKCSIFSD